MASFSATIASLLLLFILFGLSSCQQQTPVPSPSDVTGPESYIVMTVKPPPHEDKNHFSLRILSKALGGDKAASLALIYTYSSVVTGFAAHLTPDQVSALEKQPEVLGIIKSEVIQLDPPAK